MIPGNRQYEHCPPDPRIKETKKVVAPFIQAMKLSSEKYDNGSMDPEVEKAFEEIMWIKELKRQDELDAAPVFTTERTAVDFPKGA